MDSVAETQYKLTREGLTPADLVGVEASSSVTVTRSNGHRESMVYMQSLESSSAWRRWRKLDDVDGSGRPISDAKWVDLGLGATHELPRFATSPPDGGGARLERTDLGGVLAYEITFSTVAVPFTDQRKGSSLTRLWLDARSLRWLRYEDVFTYESDGVARKDTFDYSDYDSPFVPFAEAGSATDPNLHVLSGRVVGLAPGKTVLMWVFPCAQGCPNSNFSGALPDRAGRWAVTVNDGSFRIAVAATTTGPDWWYPGVSEFSKSGLVRIAGSDLHVDDLPLPPGCRSCTD